MIHPLVAQLFFTRSEFERGLEGISAEDAVKHLGPMNCISWIIGHMTWHEQKIWHDLLHGKTHYPDFVNRFAHGAPKSSPPLEDVLNAWHAVTRATTAELEKLTTADLQADLLHLGKPVGQNLGSAMLRVIYHYWYHIGEIQSIRQILGHRNLAEFVGDLDAKAPYRSEYSG